MIILIEKKEGFWFLTLSKEGEAVKYKTLLKLATALMKYARGQNL